MPRGYLSEQTTVVTDARRANRSATTLDDCNRFHGKGATAFECGKDEKKFINLVAHQFVQKQIRSEHAEHNSDRLIGKEFGRRYQGSPDT
jgi:hypothetical protein